jgi:O-antigen ligase
MFISSNNEEVLGFFGKDATLTGRIELWKASMEMISRRPFLGYGFRATFTTDSEIFDLLAWKDAPSAHNHWLDSSLDIGLIAILVFAFGYLRNIARAVRLIRHQGTVESLYPLTLLSFLLIVLMATNSLLSMLDTIWMAYVATTLTLAQLEGRKAKKVQPTTLPSDLRTPVYG